jgi:hypothetical protein
MAANDLTTLDAVRLFRQKPTTDTNQNELISSLITRASVAIMNYANREFAPTTSQTARKFLYTNNGLVDLSPYDLRAIGAGYVKIDSDTASPTTLTTDQYRLYPRQSPDVTYGWMKFDRALWWGGPNYSWEREVEVKGDWGFASVPADVEEWCIVTVGAWLDRDSSVVSTTFNISEDRLDRPEALPSAVRAGLNTYKRDTLF